MAKQTKGTTGQDKTAYSSWLGVGGGATPRFSPEADRFKPEPEKQCGFMKAIADAIRRRARKAFRSMRPRKKPSTQPHDKIEEDPPLGI